MTIRPGRNLLRVGIALVAISLGSFWWSGMGWVVGLMTVGLLGLVVREFRILRQRQPLVKVKRIMPDIVGRDVPCRIEWRVDHDGLLRSRLELRDQLPVACEPPFQTHVLHLAAGSTAQHCSSEIRIPVRGAFEFGPLWLRLSSPLELLDAQWTLDSRAKIKVLPEAFSSPDSLKYDRRAAMLLLDRMSHTRQLGAGTEFDQLAEFRDGDDPRRIDWKTSARYGRPIVRRFRIERHRDVMLIVDCGRLMGADAGRGSKLDCAVDSALMLGRTVLETGDRCGLALFDDQVLGYLPPVAGSSGLRALKEGICDVQSRWREADFTRVFAELQQRQSKRSLMVILSDIVDESTSTRFRASLGSLCKRHVVLFAALQTPLLRQVVRSTVTSVEIGAQQAVAFRLLREREQALQSLRHSGVHVVDVEPQELTVPLINQFIELRQGTLL